MKTYDLEKPVAVCGVAGRFTNRHARDEHRWLRQRWISEPRKVGDEYGYPPEAYIVAELRFDDECGNGHNSFAATAEIRVPREGMWSCGMLHDEIARYFPELAHLLRWHLCSSGGPLHYVSNTVYLAGNRDCWGKRAGEALRYVDAVRFGTVPIKHRIDSEFARFLMSCDRDFRSLAVTELVHDEPTTFEPKYSFTGFATRWHQGPFDTHEEATDFLSALLYHTPRLLRIATAFSKGKERELDKARAVAIWPEATDEELSAEPPVLMEALRARLPKLIADFRADIEAAGFLWEPEA